MKFRIGVDFDNTIVCYEKIFYCIAQTLGLLDKNDRLSKIEVREKIRSEPGGDLTWQKLQGQVYGKYMHLASAFPGFLEFLYLSKLRGHLVFVVSHKSAYGHFDEKRMSLRDAAMNWMYANRLLGTEPFALSQDEVFFEPTRESKIDRIKALGCTHFIDDLPEIFEEPKFPKDIERFLFDPQHITWRELTQIFYGDWSETEVCLITQVKFPALNVQKTELIKGHGNSRIFKLTEGHGTQYALKVYPDRQLDNRPRLETEFSACRDLEATGFSVTKALVKDEGLNWAVYGWLSGSTVQLPDEKFIDESANFVEQLLKESQSLERFENFPEASEACLSGMDIERQIRERFKRLKQVELFEISQFLDEEFLPTAEFSLQAARKDVNGLFEMPLVRSMQSLSPSDFGAHNAIINDESGRIVFIDFEYFGWDDPVKLVCDFYFHPGMNLSGELKEKWIHRAKAIFKKDASFETRLKAYLPLFGLRWCLILLNEFLPNRLKQRIHANNLKATDVEVTRLAQLDKSKNLLKQVIKISENGPTLKTA